VNSTCNACASLTLTDRGSRARRVDLLIILTCKNPSYQRHFRVFMPSDIDPRPISTFRWLISKSFLFFTIFLISFLVYTLQIFILYPAHGRVISMELLRLLVPFNVLTGLIWWNFYKCATTDPGGVPKGWVSRLG
jgi:hypothetical protein